MEIPFTHPHSERKSYSHLAKEASLEKELNFEQPNQNKNLSWKTYYGSISDPLKVGRNTVNFLSV